MSEGDSRKIKDDSFKRERKAYLSMKQKLLDEGHSGKFAAFYQGRLVAIDNDETRLIARVREKLGPIRALIQKIQEKEPVVRLPRVRSFLRRVVRKDLILFFLYFILAIFWHQRGKL